MVIDIAPPQDEVPHVLLLRFDPRSDRHATEVQQTSLSTTTNDEPSNDPSCAPRAQSITTSANATERYATMKYYDCVSQYAVDLFLSHCGACASVTD